VAQLLVALVALVIAAGWWIAAVLLWPAADRPYIGGSTDNNPLQLAFGYNGLQRLLGNSGGAGGGGAGGGGGNSMFGGATGVQRLFSGEMGLEISWLLPAALLLLAAGVWLTWRSRRTDPVRAGLIVWGGWLLVTAVTFSYMKGTIHPYYTVALAPAVAALVGIGGVLLWQRRGELGRSAYAVLAATVVVTCAWDVKLLRSQSSFQPSVAVVALVVSLAAVVALAVVAWRAPVSRRVLAGAVVGTGLALAIPVAAWGVATAGTPHSGSIPTAVATSSSGGFGGGGGAPGSSGGGSGGTVGGGTVAGGKAGAGKASAGKGGAGGASVGRTGGKPSGAAGKLGGPSAGGQLPGGRPGSGQAPTGQGETGEVGRPSGAGSRSETGGRGMAGGGGGVTVSSALTTALEKTTTRWAAATDGSQSAASLELATGGKAVMAIGGFTGSDPAPTLAQFKAYVAAGDITYYIVGGQGGGGPGGGSGNASQITSWVEAHYTATKIGGQTVYVLHK
jgi:hypothetical protein